MIKDEIFEHSNHYAPYITSTTQLLNEMKDYEIYGSDNSNTVDLFLHALATSTKTSVNLIQKQNDRIESLIIPPARKDVAPQQMIMLSRVCNHYSPIVDLATVAQSKLHGNLQELLPTGHYQILESSPINEVSSEPEMSHCSVVTFDSDSYPSASSSDKIIDSVLTQGNKTYISSDVWKDIELEYVEKLPHDINGTRVFVVPYDVSNTMRNTTDGRNWKRYMTSKRKGFKGTRRVAQCNGSDICKNDMCPYKQEYNDRNKSEFQKDGNGSLACIQCGASSSRLECSARKIWEIDHGKKETKVYHFGQHTCKVHKRPTQKSDDIKIRFKENINLKPEAFIRGSVIDALQTGKPWDGV